MAAKFSVNPQELVKQAESLQQLNERFKTEVEAMTDKEQALSGMWEGEARNAFHNAYAVNAEKFQTFYNGIAQFAEALIQSAQKYSAAEQQAAEIAKS